MIIGIDLFSHFFKEIIFLYILYVYVIFHQKIYVLLIKF